MSYFSNLSQNVQVSSGNSSTANIGAGGTFTGTSQSTLGIAGIQVTLKTTQNCTVYVEQSPDDSHWDIVDQYNYFVGKNFGITVQAVNSYVRVRVTNLSATTATTELRLQTCLCPIVEAVPRSLSANGRLVTASGLLDLYGFAAENSPTGELRVAEMTRLVGTTFDGDTIDSRFWTTAATGVGALIAQANAQILLTSGTANAATVTAYTLRRARYVSGCSMRYRAVVQLGDTGTADNKRRWGIGYGATMPTVTDGAYFQVDGTTFSIVTCKGGIETKVDSGSFNGDYGTSYALTTSVKTYEIYWTNSKIYFVIGDVMLHTVSASSATWSATMNFHAFMDSLNSNALGASVTLAVRVASIHRIGSLITQPTSYYHALGTTAGVNLKLGAGNLHSVIVSSVVNNAVITLSDSITTTTPVIWAHTATATAQPLQTLNLDGVPFFTGLRLTVSAANASVVVVYE